MNYIKIYTLSIISIPLLLIAYVFRFLLELLSEFYIALIWAVIWIVLGLLGISAISFLVLFLMEDIPLFEKLLTVVIGVIGAGIAISIVFNLGAMIVGIVIQIVETVISLILGIFTGISNWCWKNFQKSLGGMVNAARNRI